MTLPAAPERTADTKDTLECLVAEYERGGCEHCDRSLGAQKMPDGYALMLDHDRIFYFWLYQDGSEGPSCWDKWWVRRGAIAHSKASDARTK